MTQDSQPSSRGLLTGASYPVRALALLFNTPQLQQYMLFPILLNLGLGITLYAGLLFAGLQAIDALIAAIPVWIANVPALETDWVPWTISLPDWHVALPDWFPALPSLSLPSLPAFQLPHLHLPSLPAFQLPTFEMPITFAHWLADLSEFGLTLLIWLLRLLLSVTLLLLTGFVLLQFGVVLGAPWYGQLSQQIEQMQVQSSATITSITTISIHPAQEIWRAISYELKKLAILLVVGTPLLLSHLFPGLGTLVATGGGIALAATIVCLDFLDGALERRRLRFRQKLGVIRQTFPASAGFALVCLGLVSIPFLNLLAIPVCVAAGTLFYCEQVLPQEPRNHP